MKSKIWLLLALVMALPSVALAIQNVEIKSQDIQSFGRRVVASVEGTFDPGENERATSVLIVLLDKDGAIVKRERGVLGADGKSFTATIEGKNAVSYRIEVLSKGRDKRGKRIKQKAVTQPIALP